MGYTKMSKLLIYKNNGIYDLIMTQKINEEDEKKEYIQNELIKEARNNGAVDWPCGSSGNAKKQGYVVLSLGL